jgi:hypothetical protein
MGVHNCRHCKMLCADCHPLCMFCRTEVQRREIDRDLCEATTGPPRPRGSREMLGTVAVAILILLAFAITGTMDYQAAQAMQIGGK